MKVAGKSKRIDRMRNTDCREKPNLYDAIDTGCIFNKSANENSTLELKCMTLNTLVTYNCF